MGKGECAVLKANESSVSSIIPASVLSKLGIVSFSAVLISAIIKRMIKDLKEVRGDSEDDYDEDDTYENDIHLDEVDECEKRVMRF